MPKSQTKVFPSSEDAANFLADFVKSGDLLLVKGSRGVKMERIVDAVLARQPGSPAVPAASAEQVRH
jgi:UDP-N-acetylmuramyl pentapeptide synthase